MRLWRWPRPATPEKGATSCIGPYGTVYNSREHHCVRPSRSIFALRERESYYGVADTSDALILSVGAFDFSTAILSTGLQEEATDRVVRQPGLMFP